MGMIPIGVRRGCAPSTGGSGFLQGSADPDVGSLTLPQGQLTGTFNLTNTIDRAGVATILGDAKFSVSPSSDIVVPSGGSVAITVNALSFDGPATGTLTVKSSAGDFSIGVSSDVTYIPAGLTPVAVYDFAEMYVRGAYSDGDTLGSIPDYSGNAHDASTTGALTFDEDAFGSVGEAGIGSQGSYRYLVPPQAILNAFNSSQAGEVWVVARRESTIQRGPLVELGNAQSYDHHPYASGAWYSSFGSSTRKYGNGSDILTKAAVRFTQSSNQNRIILTQVTAGADIINEVQAYSGFGYHPHRIGGGGSGSQYFNGPIGFIAYFDRLLTTGERSTLYAYLKTAYGL